MRAPVDDAPTSNEKSPAKPAVANLGTILVQVFRMRVVGPRIAGAGTPYLEPGLANELQVSEKELKGRSVMHSAKCGCSECCPLMPDLYADCRLTD